MLWLLICKPGIKRLRWITPGGSKSTHGHYICHHSLLSQVVVVTPKMVFPHNCMGRHDSGFLVSFRSLEPVPSLTIRMVFRALTPSLCVRACVYVCVLAHAHGRLSCDSGLSRTHCVAEDDPETGQRMTLNSVPSASPLQALGWRVRGTTPGLHPSGI